MAPTIPSPNDACDPDQDTPETRYVFISTGDDSEWLFLWDSITGEQLSTRPEKNKHNLIEYATSEGWEVTDGPVMTLSFNLFFRWYDLWVGAYVDVPNRTVYICPLPMFGVKVSWKERSK